MGAAEDGRAPTEELSCMRSRNFCSMETVLILLISRDSKNVEATS